MSHRKVDLIHIATSCDLFGVWEVTVLIGGKEYIYPLYSEYGYRVFLSYYNKGRMNKALHILRRFKIKSAAAIIKEQREAKCGIIQSEIDFSNS